MRVALFPATPIDGRLATWSEHDPQMWVMSRGSNMLAVIGPCGQQRAIETATLLLGNGLKVKP